MPSNLPSSFASAAAGQNANRDSRGGRTDGRGSVGGDWARRDGRSTNGTLTFRRSSTTPLGQTSMQSPVPADNAVQPPPSSENTTAPLPELGPARYTKEVLLDMYRPSKGQDDSSRLFIPGWNPNQVNGHASRGWGKSNDNHVPQEPGACWDDAADSIPMGLLNLSEEEKEAFSTEINSPLKPPTQNKEGHQGGGNGRKASLSQGTGNAFGVASPSSATRPGTRRRETVDSNPFSPGALASPTASRFSRDDPSYWFPRKNNDLKEAEPDESDTEQPGPGRETPGVKSPFGTLSRSNTGGLPGVGSIWPSSNQAAPSTGGFGNFAMPSTSAIGDKRAAAGPSGSRLAHLIPKDGSEAVGGKPGENPNPLNQQSWRSRPRTDTDPFGEENLSGSAVLGGAQDTEPTGSRAGAMGTPVKGSTGDFGMSGLNLGGHGDEHGPVSPSETNPYRSPPAERHEHDDGEGGVGEEAQEPPSNFGSISRGFGGGPFDGGDRSQTSSVGPKGYPSLGALGGWPAAGVPPIGTPDRERPNLGAAFGSSLFSPVGDVQSPGLSNLNNVFGPASSGGLGTGSISRGSKLGSLFPPAMQAQMQSHEQDNSSLSDSLPDLRQSNPLGAIGRSNFPMPARDTESPMRSNRGVFEELFPSSDANRPQGIFSTAEPGLPGATATAPQSFTPVGAGLPFGGGQPGAELPTAQVRQMVMPDRMRWVYLDPQGQVQGPFTGLEMNDWYKANFFTPDLRVKKVEDPEFEPLGQLIRRIGNSREPFLVPQIGIPHGPPAQSGPFSPQGTGGGVIPPLSGVFPSFGRTLTAEEQNNLERRKQEEQYLMVQQREFVMRQQAMTKFQMPGGPSLQHHSSAHSLQSQPSFGSMTSPNPIGMPAQQGQAQGQHQQQHQPIGAPPGTGFFEGASGSQPATAGSGNGETFPGEEQLTGLTHAERQVLMSFQGSSQAEASLRAGLPETDELQKDSEGFRERLREFEGLRAQHEAEQAAQAALEADEETGAGSEAAQHLMEQAIQQAPLTGKAARAAKKKAAEDALSLTQQVQNAQAAAAAAQETETGMPMPFPPPPGSTGTPLPAPTAQRARSNLPDQYSRSQSGTPDTTASANAQPPPLAPWAGTESQKGPSLKEIQEAEARKAAKAEEAAAALRKAAMEQEAAAQREREKAAANNAGLPATSTWGHGSPAPVGSPWSKPGAAKAVTPAASTNSKTKTLAEIQREEELRKQKAKEAMGVSGAPASTSKSYANLAGKPGQAPIGAMAPAAAVAAAAAAAVPPPGSGWATVGAGGKVKAPTGPSAPSRSVSAANVKPASSPVRTVSKPVVSANGKAEGGNTAMEEFNKWVNRELSRGITVSDISSFQATLDVLPLDTGLIADAVYANSTTMDGHHFAEEFVRRKKLAERGIVEKQPTDTKTVGGSGSSGWSEVAKKGGAGPSAPASSPAAQGGDSIQGAPFKLVPGRKKGKK